MYFNKGLENVLIAEVYFLNQGNVSAHYIKFKTGFSIMMQAPQKEHRQPGRSAA
jgi:hypothetical protein